MSWHDFLKAFLRQCMYALTFFVTTVLAAEFLAPASVTPFLDPVPLTILVLALLSADAMRRAVTPNRWVRTAFGMLSCVILVLLVLTR